MSDFEIHTKLTPQDIVTLLASNRHHEIQTEKKISAVVEQVIDVILTNNFTDNTDDRVVNVEDLIFTILMSYYLDEWFDSCKGVLPENIENAIETFVVEKIENYLVQIYFEDIYEITKSVCSGVSMELMKYNVAARDNVNDDELEYGKLLHGRINDATKMFFHEVGRDELYSIGVYSLNIIDMFQAILNTNKTFPNQMGRRYLVSKYYAQQASTAATQASTAATRPTYFQYSK